MLDFVAYKVMHGQRKAIRKELADFDGRYKAALKSHGIDDLAGNAFIWYKAPELAKTLAAYPTPIREFGARCWRWIPNLVAALT
jgi:hypothetical protein